MRPVTPRGFRDVLPQEAAEREALTRAMSDVMASWGYGSVETPVVEQYPTLEAGAGGAIAGEVFRLFDADGGLLALRPEMTVPIGRLVATRFAGETGPFRLRYSADVFREQASMRGQSRQFTQVGLEFVGAGGAAADAEVVAVLVESLRATGLASFVVGVGTVAVLRAILGTAAMPAEWSQSVLAAAHDRNLVGIDELASAPGVPEQVTRALREVPRIRGDRGAIARCRVAASGCGADAALDELDEMWALLESAGVADAVSADFGIMRSFDYYTGMVLEVYAPGLGLTLGGGGRYDGLLAEFGAPAQAAGFAVGLERLHIALAEQRVEIAVPALDAVIGGDAADAFAAGARLRAAGWRVRLSQREGLELVREAERVGASEALLAQESRITRLDRAGERALALEEPAPEPPSATWAREDGAR